jgi:hypothetical protein
MILVNHLLTRMLLSATLSVSCPMNNHRMSTGFIFFPTEITENHGNILHIISLPSAPSPPLSALSASLLDQAEAFEAGGIIGTVQQGLIEEDLGFTEFAHLVIGPGKHVQGIIIKGIHINELFE